MTKELYITGGKPDGYEIKHDGEGKLVTKVDNTTVRIMYTLAESADVETGHVTIILPAATKKVQPAASEGLAGDIGKITGTTPEMKYAASENATVWTDCSADVTKVDVGVWYIRYKETATAYPGLAAAVRVKGISTGTLDISDLYYGMVPRPTVTSSTNVVESARIEYKERNAKEMACQYWQAIPS